MGKNIVVFSDGTGQEGGKGANTNVYKLFNKVLDRSPEQNRVLRSRTRHGLAQNHR